MDICRDDGDREFSPSLVAGTLRRACYGLGWHSPHRLRGLRAVTLRSIKGFGLPLLQKLARALMFDEEY
jgi:hypothetical protein